MATAFSKESYVYEEGYSIENGRFYRITITYRDGSQHIRTFYENLKTKEIRRRVKA